MARVLVPALAVAYAVLVVAYVIGEVHRELGDPGDTDYIGLVTGGCGPRLRLSLPLLRCDPTGHRERHAGHLPPSPSACQLLQHTARGGVHGALRQAAASDPDRGLRH